MSDDEPDLDMPAFPGDWVRAKRACWNEVLTPEQLWDHDPCECTDDHELEGELEICWVPPWRPDPELEEIPGHANFTVDGHSCDPQTIVVTPRPARIPKGRWPSEPVDRARERLRRARRARRPG